MKKKEANQFTRRYEKYFFSDWANIFARIFFLPKYVFLIPKCAANGNLLFLEIEQYVQMPMTPVSITLIYQKECKISVTDSGSQWIPTFRILQSFYNF